jgi:hypothetical protein
MPAKGSSNLRPAFYPAPKMLVKAGKDQVVLVQDVDPAALCSVDTLVPCPCQSSILRGSVKTDAASR